ncbi:MAG: hypothetical protein AB4041_04125 [Microcystaceae cyanobacterium]
MINQSSQQKTEIFNKIIQEINLIPTDQQEKLLRLISIFRQATTDDSRDIKLNSLEQKNKAIIDLLDKWEKEGDEQEQTETLGYLQEVLS